MIKAMFAIAAVLAMPAAASAAQIVLTPASVIGSSGAYSSAFAADNIFSQQTGIITETFANGYWINPDNGPADAYITADLGGLYSLSSIELFNTQKAIMAIAAPARSAFSAATRSLAASLSPRR